MFVEGLRSADDMTVDTGDVYGRRNLCEKKKNVDKKSETPARPVRSEGSHCDRFPKVDDILDRLAQYTDIDEHGSMRRV